MAKKSITANDFESTVETIGECITTKSAIDEIKQVNERLQAENKELQTSVAKIVEDPAIKSEDVVYAGQIENLLEEAQVTITRLQRENEQLREGYITDEMYRALQAPLPVEAVEPHKKNPKLSAIKAIYIIERWNEVFGIGGWTYESEIVENDPSKAMIVVKVKWQVARFNIYLESYGGNANEDRGDAYKGAVTDALSKIGGMMGVGMDVYKGFGPTTEHPLPVPHRKGVTSATVVNGHAPAGAVSDKCFDCKSPIKAVEIKGEQYSVNWLIDNSMKKYDRPLCAACQQKASKARSEVAKEPVAAPIR